MKDEAIYFLDKYLNESQEKIHTNATNRKSESTNNTNATNRKSESTNNTNATNRTCESGEIKAKNLADNIDVTNSDQINIDMELRLNDVNDRLYSQIEKLAPFGVGNKKPVFLFRKVVPFSVRKLSLIHISEPTRPY